MFKLRFKKPNVLFALFVILFMWVFHLKSDWMVIPRYLALLTCSSAWPCRV